MADEQRKARNKRKAQRRKPAAKVILADKRAERRQANAQRKEQRHAKIEARGGGADGPNQRKSEGRA